MASSDIPQSLRRTAIWACGSRGPARAGGREWGGLVPLGLDPAGDGLVEVPERVGFGERDSRRSWNRRRPAAGGEAGLEVAEPGLGRLLLAGRSFGGRFAGLGVAGSRSGELPQAVGVEGGRDDGSVANRSARRETGALESEVLAHLWAADEALTAGEVLATMAGDLAYTTVLTILTRLHKKGLVEREPRGRAYAYRPAVTEAELTAKRMRLALDRAGDREAVLMHFVGELSGEDEEAFRRLVKALKKR